jgi:hypothetical protein
MHVQYHIPPLVSSHFDPYKLLGNRIPQKLQDIAGNGILALGWRAERLTGRKSRRQINIPLIGALLL